MLASQISPSLLEGGRGRMETPSLPPCTVRVGRSSWSGFNTSACLTQGQTPKMAFRPFVWVGFADSPIRPYLAFEHSAVNIYPLYFNACYSRLFLILLNKISGIIESSWAPHYVVRVLPIQLAVAIYIYIATVNRFTSLPRGAGQERWMKRCTQYSTSVHCCTVLFKRD